MEIPTCSELGTSFKPFHPREGRTKEKKDDKEEEEK
jgi:hypothetical protein